MIFYRILVFFMLPWLFFREKHKKNTRDRQAKYDGAPPEKPVIWCHGASIGECMSFLPILNDIHKKFPHIQVILTHQTIGAIKSVKQKLPPNAVMHYIPFDHTRYINRFFAYWNPMCILWIESEFWPGFFSTIKKRGIPCFLLNARLSDKSYKAWSFFPWAIRYILSVFTEIYVGAKEDILKFNTFTHKPVKFIGNLKFYISPLPVDTENKERLIKQIKNRPFFLAASTHPGEEEIIIDVYKKLKEKRPNLLLILVPRKPDRAQELINTFDVQKNWALRSKKDDIVNKTEVYLVDTFGELGTFFSLSSIVIMGGGIISHGGHNIIEPAMLKCAVISGPYFDSNREIYEDFLKASAIIISESKNLVKNIEPLLNNEAKVKKLQAAALKVTEDQYATKHVYLKMIREKIENALKSS